LRLLRLACRWAAPAGPPFRVKLARGGAPPTLAADAARSHCGACQCGGIRKWLARGASATVPATAARCRLPVARHSVAARVLLSTSPLRLPTRRPATGTCQRPLGRGCGTSMGHCEARFITAHFRSLPLKAAKSPAPSHPLQHAPLTARCSNRAAAKRHTGPPQLRQCSPGGVPAGALGAPPAADGVGNLTSANRKP
jgi:hypothetical protein